MDNQIITHETAEGISIELTKNAKGDYQWTIKVNGKSEIAVTKTVIDIDNVLAAKYNKTVEIK